MSGRGSDESAVDFDGAEGLLRAWRSGIRPDPDLTVSQWADRHRRLPYHLVTGDVRQANYSSLRAELVEFRRRIGQLQHGVIVHQLCRAVWRRWLETAVLSGALEADPAEVRPVQWIPPRWDWVDPLKDIQAQVLAMEAGITSRRKVVEATGYDIEEIDRENAADAARATGLGLRYRTSPGETQGARATPATRAEPGNGAGNDTDDGAATTDPATEQE